MKANNHTTLINLKKWLPSFIFITLLSLGLQKTYAQTDPSGGLSIPGQINEIQEQVSVDVSPANPNPGDPVNVTIAAYGTNLSDAMITWKVNGATVQKDQGLTSLDTTAGSEGNVSTIDIYIDPSNGPEIHKVVTIQPETTDVVWEADTYTPPFYKGKPLYTRQQQVTIAAFPNFTASGQPGLDINHLNYRWEDNLDTVPDYSGYGKNYMIYQGPLVASDELIGLEVTNAGSADSKTYFRMPLNNPNVLVYENSPLYGVMFNKAVPASFNLGGSQTSLVAYPYFFGFASRNDPDAVYTWSMGGEPLNVPVSQSSLVFNNNQNQSGNTDVSIDVKSVKSFLLEASQDLDITFNASNNNANASL